MKCLTVSIHDVSSRYESEIEEIVQELDARGITPRNQFVIPYLEKKHNLSSTLCSLLGDDEIFLHGFTHSKKGNDREFKFIGYEDALRRIDRGISHLHDHWISRPKGFVPPYYKISPGGKLAVKARFRFLVTNPYIEDFDKNLRLSSTPICYWPYNSTVDKVFRIYDQFMAKAYLKDNPLVRVDIHPQDLWKTRPFDSALKMIDYLRKERELVTLSAYLDRL